MARDGTFLGFEPFTVVLIESVGDEVGGGCDADDKWSGRRADTCSCGIWTNRFDEEFFFDHVIAVPVLGVEEGVFRVDEEENGFALLHDASSGEQITNEILRHICNN
jgi:hypothetical protein